MAGIMYTMQSVACAALRGTHVKYTAETQALDQGSGDCQLSYASAELPQPKWRGEVRNHFDKGMQQ